MQLIDEKQEAGDVVDKITFKFADNKVTYSREVNGEVLDGTIEHAIEESTLDPHVEQTWSESMFSGVGNKNM